MPISCFFHYLKPYPTPSPTLDGTSPHGSPSVPKINSMYHRNSQISFGGAFDRYKGEVSIQKLPISSFFHSYPITLFGWYIVYLSPHKRAELTQHDTAKARFPIVDHLMAIKEKRPLANCQYQIFSATPTLLPSLDGT